MQPTVFNSIENFNNKMALRIFLEATLQWMSENKCFRYDLEIKNIYFDMGQNWMWTTIVVTDEDTDSSWQAFCPRDWELIVEETDINKIIAMAWFYMDNLQKPYNERKNLYERF